MSDTETSGAALDEPTATTPAAQASGDLCASAHTDENTPEQVSQPEVPQQHSDFAFGTSRGSGLARGKRKIATAPDTPAAQAANNGYQPTAIEVITPKSEYANPFTGETVVETPRQENAPQTEEEAKAEALPTNATPSSEETVSDPESSTPLEEPETPPTAPAEAAPKPELKILPPAQPNRSRQSWESPSVHPAHRAAAASGNGENANSDSAAEAPRSRSPRGSSEGRPTFQPERRSRTPRSGEVAERLPHSEKPSREERPKRESRAPREPRERIERTERAPRTAGSPSKPAAKPQGFFGWLKSLFGGGDSKPSSSRPKSAHGHGNAQSREDGPRRRSRGGRGRSSSNGPRTGSESFSSRHDGEKNAGDRSVPNRNSEEQRDRPRNRSRGGRGGRSRGGPRAEGQQSGGAI